MRDVVAQGALKRVSGRHRHSWLRLSSHMDGKTLRLADAACAS